MKDSTREIISASNELISSIKKITSEKPDISNLRTKVTIQSDAKRRITKFIEINKEAIKTEGLFLSMGKVSDNEVYFYEEKVFMNLEAEVVANYYIISTEAFGGETVPLSQLNGNDKVLNLREIIYIKDYLNQDTSKGKDKIKYDKGQMDEALVQALKAKHQKVLASNSGCVDRLKSGFGDPEDFKLAVGLGLAAAAGGAAVGTTGITKTSRDMVDKVFGSLDDYVKNTKRPKFTGKLLKTRIFTGAAVAAAIGFGAGGLTDTVKHAGSGAAFGAFAPISFAMGAFLYKKSLGKKLRGDNAAKWLMGSGLSIASASAVFKNDNSCWSYALAFGLVLGGLYGGYKKGLRPNFLRESMRAIGSYKDQKQLQAEIEAAFLDKVYRIRDLQLVDAVDEPPIDAGWLVGGMPEELRRGLFTDAFRPPTKLLGTSDAINSHMFFDKDRILKHPAAAQYELDMLEKGIDTWELAMKRQYREVSESVVLDINNLFGKIGREESEFVSKMINRSTLMTKLSKGMDNPGQAGRAQKTAVTEFLEQEYMNILGQKLPEGKSASIGLLFDQGLLNKMHFTSGGKSKVFKSATPEQVGIFKRVSDDYFNSIMTGVKKSDDEIKALGEKFKKDMAKEVFDIAGNTIKKNIQEVFGSPNNFFSAYEKVVKGAHTLKDVLIDIETAKRTVKNIAEVENARVSLNDIEKISKNEVERVFQNYPRVIAIVNGRSNAVINALKGESDLGWMAFATIVYGGSAGYIASLFPGDAADEIKAKIDTLNSTYDDFDDVQKTKFINYVSRTAIGKIRKLQVEDQVKKGDLVSKVIDRISTILTGPIDLYETAVKLTLQHNLELKDADLKKSVMDAFGLEDNSLAVYAKLTGALDELKIREALGKKSNNIKESNVYNLDNIRSLVCEVIREQQENELPSLQDKLADNLEPRIATVDPGMGEYYNKVLKFAQTKLPFGDNVYRVEYGAIQNTTENAPALLDEETADSFYNLLLDWINTGLEPLKLHGKTPSYDSVLNASDRKETSQHKHGMALDINIPYAAEDPMHLKYKQKLLELSLKSGFRGFGFGPTVMHIDLRQEYGWWIYGGEKWDFAGTIGSVIPIRSSAFRDLGLAAGGWPSSEVKQTFLAMTDIKNKKGVREVKKQDLNKLMVEFLNENSGQGYSKYPYSSSVEDEEEPREDYVEEWKALSIEVIRDESRDTAIQIAKILVKDLELFEDVLDLAGQNQSIGTEILTKLKQSKEKA